MVSVKYGRSIIKREHLYEMKEMSKAKIIDKSSEKDIKGERDLLSNYS